MHLETAPDLDWTAFRYVAGELSPAEASAFEDLLADDQRAREAVAGAVELAGATFMAGADDLLLPPIARRSTGRRVLAWSVAAVAAACLLVLARPAGPTKVADLALAWSDLRAETDLDWPAIVAEMPHEPAASTETEVMTDVESDAKSERGIPSWMLAAASSQVEAPPREEN